jgi:hypothetical protein
MKHFYSMTLLFAVAGVTCREHTQSQQKATLICSGISCHWVDTVLHHYFSQVLTTRYSRFIGG